MTSDPLKELERLPQEWLKSVAETECYESPYNVGLERVATLRRCADELAALLSALRKRIAAAVEAEREACRDLVRDWKFNSKASAQEATTTLMQAIEKRGPFDALERAKEEARREGRIAALREAEADCEAQRQKILGNPDDPSWTEHLAEVEGVLQQKYRAAELGKKARDGKA